MFNKELERQVKYLANRIDEERNYRWELERHFRALVASLGYISEENFPKLIYKKVKYEKGQ